MAAKPPTFLSISDLHFNPCYDPAIIDELAAAEPAEWDEVFRRSTLTGLGPYHRDTGWPLLQSLLGALRAHDPGFVIFSGDFLAHRLQEQHRAGARDPSDGAFRAFIGKTLQYLALRFGEVFPGRAFFPCLGNDDALCGDYEIAPFGELLQLLTEIWQPLMQASLDAGESSFADTFPIGGYYHAALPGLPGARLVVLNNIFMSVRYVDACRRVPGDPAAAMLHWLRWVLYLCEAQGEQIWLVMHEPPGVDVYGVVHGRNDSCAGNVSTFMDSAHWRMLSAELDAERGIRLIFSGHTHMDDFRLLSRGRGRPPSLYVHITPAVSPVFGNNPAYQLWELDGGSGAPTDYTTCYLDLANPAAGWTEEYRFQQAYGQGALSVDSLSKICSAIADDQGIRELYLRYFGVARPPGTIIGSDSWQAFHDGITCLTKQQFVARHCPDHQSSVIGRVKI